MGLWMKRRAWLGVIAAIAMAPAGAWAQDGMVIFAAASLKNALDEIAGAWSKETGKPAPKISYAASSALAKQMEQGAPADMFISADTGWMDYVDKKDLIKKDTRVNLLGNKIVLIAPRDSTTTVAVKPGFDLAKALAGGKLAMANVDRCRPAVRQGGAREARRPGRRQGQHRAGRHCAAPALVARGEAPSASSMRPTPRPSPT